MVVEEATGDHPEGKGNGEQTTAKQNSADSAATGAASREGASTKNGGNLFLTAY